MWWKSLKLNMNWRYLISDKGIKRRCWMVCKGVFNQVIWKKKRELHEAYLTRNWIKVKPFWYARNLCGNYEKRLGIEIFFLDQLPIRSGEKRTTWISRNRIKTNGLVARGRLQISRMVLKPPKCDEPKCCQPTSFISF